MASIEHQTNTRLGLIGAGRLAQAVARTWLVRTGEGLLVWSRSGRLNCTETRVAEGIWVTDWTSVLEAIDRDRNPRQTITRAGGTERTSEAVHRKCF